MKRGFLNKKKPHFQEFSGSSACHQAVWESLSRQGSAPTKTLDITELLNNASEDESTSASGAERFTRIIAGEGQTLPRPSFEDKTKSVLMPNLIHRIPSLATTQGREPSSVCLLWSSTLERVTKTPGYPGTLPKTRLPTLFTIEPAPNMGLGLFAKLDIKVSELVLAERPLLVVPPTIPVVSDKPEQLSWSDAEIRRSSIEIYDKILEDFLGAMRREDADAFKNLENRYGEDGYKSFGIVKTNGYPIDFDEGNDLLNYRAIGNKGSRINHSCTPNLYVEFDAASFSLQYSAIRDIKAGEQLFYAYCSPMQLVKERQEALGEYKFVCRCTACENATPESDEARVRLSRLWKKLLLLKFKGSSLVSLLAMEREMMKEGLDFWRPFPLLLDAIAKVYIKLRNQKKAREYKEKMAKYHPGIFKVVKGG